MARVPVLAILPVPERKGSSTVMHSSFETCRSEGRVVRHYAAESRAAEIRVFLPDFHSVNVKPVESPEVSLLAGQLWVSEIQGLHFCQFSFVHRIFIILCTAAAPCLTPFVWLRSWTGRWQLASALGDEETYARNSDSR
jgi:hypothetical protein